MTFAEAQGITSVSHSYLKQEDDGLPLRRSGEWTAEKLYYLSRYLDIFTTGMHNQPARGFHYVDLFAGPGKAKIETTDEIILGSPILALGQRFPFTNYHFVENDKARFEALQERVSTSPLVTRTILYPEDANSAVHSIVDGIKAADDMYQPEYHSTLNVAFVDPEGLDAEWATIEKLAEVKRMDLVIHYPVMALNRNMVQALESLEDSAVNRFFGDGEWRRILETYAQRGTPAAAHRELINHYRAKLEARGYQEVQVDQREPLMKTGATKVPLYRLIFASKHPLGHDFWEKISGRDPSGQLSFW